MSNEINTPRSSFLPQTSENRGVGGGFVEGLLGPYKLAVHNLRVAYKGDTSVKVDTVTNRVFRATAGEPARVKAGALRRIGHALLGVASFIPLVNYIPYGLTLLFYMPKREYEVIDQQDPIIADILKGNLSQFLRMDAHEQATALQENPRLISDTSSMAQKGAVYEDVLRLQHASPEVQKELIEGYSDPSKRLGFFDHSNQRGLISVGSAGSPPSIIRYASLEVQKEVFRDSDETAQKQLFKELHSSIQDELIGRDGVNPWIEHASPEVQRDHIAQASHEIQKELVRKENSLLGNASEEVQRDMLNGSGGFRLLKYADSDLQREMVLANPRLREWASF